MQSSAALSVGKWWLFQLPHHVLITFASHVWRVHLLVRLSSGTEAEVDGHFDHKRMSCSVLHAQLTYLNFFKILRSVVTSLLWIVLSGLNINTVKLDKLETLKSCGIKMLIRECWADELISSMYSKHKSLSMIGNIASYGIQCDRLTVN